MPRPGAAEGGGLRLSAAAVAARLGVSASTLRTWHRRYGIGPTAHTPGRHRRYTLDDLARLQRMCALVATGVPPASAADVGVRSDADARVARDRSSPSARTPPGPAPSVRGLLRAAARLDGAGVRRVVAEHLTARGAVATWEDLCVPALVELGAGDGSGRAVAAEHVVSWAIGAVLQAPAGPAAPALEPAVLLACAPGERHVLPLDALRAALAEHGTAVRMLGQDVPTPALLDTIARVRPAVVAVWARTTRTGRVAALPAGAGSRSPVVMPLGPGWDGRRVPTPAVRAATLSEAVATIRSLLDAGR